MTLEQMKKRERELLWQINKKAMINPPRKGKIIWLGFYNVNSKKG